MQSEGTAPADAKAAAATSAKERIRGQAPAEILNPKWNSTFAITVDEALTPITGMNYRLCE